MREQEHSDFTFYVIGKEVCVSALMCFGFGVSYGGVDGMDDVWVSDWLHLFVCV